MPVSDQNAWFGCLKLLVLSDRAIVEVVLQSSNLKLSPFIDGHYLVAFFKERG